MMTTAISSSFSTSAIDDVLNYAARFHQYYGLIIVVLDHISDSQSHIAQLTSQLYPILKKNIRSTDTIIRFTQDAWLICLDKCDERLLRWIQYVIESSLYHRCMQSTNALEGALTIIRGSFLSPTSLNQALRTVESEVQLAKNTLRRLKMTRSTALGTENQFEETGHFLPFIHKAILDNRLFLAFQPIVETVSRQLHHYECLARILDENGNILPAGKFISSCEKTGLIQLIDQKIQQLAVEELLKSRSIHLAINVSAITASNPLWLNTLKSHMTTHPHLQGRLSIEITETALFQNTDESIAFISQLRDLGCSVSIDDFGAGYMSLTHIKNDLVQTIKIDAQFVKDLKTDPNNISFIRAISALTNPLGIKCIAEGVEDFDTAIILSEENIHYLQGYHIGKPSHLRTWL